jgi:uncharacterized protein (TIGR03790 family)
MLCMRASLVCLIGSSLLGFGALDARAQSAVNVVVVANDASPASVEIAEYYVSRRGIPADHLIRIRTITADQITRLQFATEIQAPIARWLTRHAAQDRILFIVLTKGVPLRIAGTPGRKGTSSSVDSELTVLYRRMTGQPIGPNGPVENPYFLGDKPIAEATRFSHATQDLFLVTRLDGFTTDEAKALVDRGMAAATGGRVLLDQRAGLNQKPNEWLAAAAKKLEEQGHGSRVLLEQTSRTVEPQGNVFGYYSWGSNDPAINERDLGLEFSPGALAAMFVSTDARTFTEPPPDWKPGRGGSRQAFFADSPQSLTGDLVRAGVTGAAGYVAEPFLDSSVRPDILFPAYFAGFTLAEAFYLATPALSWQTVIVGDPLCAPFAKTSVAAADLDPPIDKATEMPTLFSRRRLVNSGLKTDSAAGTLLLRAEVRIARDDRDGARQALEEAVRIDDSLIDAWRGLSSLYEEAQDYDKAAQVYRKLIDRDPKDASALNNLAYALAVREHQPAEALPLAERALLLQPRNPTIADTVGWIKHLLGDHAGALKLLEPAAKALPENADVQLHVAVVYAASGRIADATAALKRAEEKDPAVKDRPEYQQVMQVIR